jgi:hypothetical protein
MTSPVDSEAWIARQLAKAGPLTQEQQAELRRVLLPPKPVKRPA